MHLHDRINLPIGEFWAHKTVIFIQHGKIYFNPEEKACLDE
jgi:hypothetical protein